MTPSELRKRLADFAVAIYHLTRPLLQSIDTQDATRQLRRAATGAAANHRGAGRGRSDADFANKIGIASEEADEVVYWLEHMRGCDMFILVSPTLL